MILGMLECLGIELLLDVMGLGEELGHNVCSGHQLRPVRICATGWVGVPMSLDLASPSFFCCCVRADNVGPSPMILGMLEYLGIELLLDVVGLGEELEPKFCSGNRPRLEARHFQF